jgi:hypothetical protein
MGWAVNQALRRIGKEQQLDHRPQCVGKQGLAVPSPTLLPLSYQALQVDASGQFCVKGVPRDQKPSGRQVEDSEM